jgi:hypothetical protein
LASIRAGDLLSKPGWVRLSIHPTMTNAEIDFILDAVESTVANFQQWRVDYHYNPVRNEYSFIGKEIKVPAGDFFRSLL